jgi:anti-sigma regulatory factor (Ser/Thr protein kinase)
MSQADLVLSPNDRAPSKARELLATFLADRAGSEGFERAQLALSEVVSNAVRYGGAAASAAIKVKVEQTDDLLRVQVVQPGPVPERPSIIDMPPAWSTGGYGLGIIDAIVDRWGIHVEPPSVWFELHL